MGALLGIVQIRWVVRDMSGATQVAVQLPAVHSCEWYKTNEGEKTV